MMKLTIFSNLKCFLTLTTFLALNCAQVTNLNATVVPAGSEIMLSSARYDNGYSRERFDLITTQFERFWRPHFESLGGQFFLDTDWGDGAVNAWAWKEGSRYSLEIPGGLSRFHTMSEEAFVMVLCHELGHLMGGAPARNSQISLEGQADYFAAQKCFPRFFEVIRSQLGGFQSGPARTIFSEEANFEVRCQGHQDSELCQHSLLGSLGPSAYYAELEKSKTPSLATADTSVVRSTLTTHPKAQCRFDTMVLASFCPADVMVTPSWTDANVGFCHRDFWAQFARPECWFRP